MFPIYYALGLHMHQPPDNLAVLADHNEWEAQQIINCYDRAAKYALKYPQINFHVDFSGILLEQFRDPAIIEKYRRWVDLPQMLANYRQAKNIEIIGMGYFHPIFPLIPKEDWKEQLDMGRDIAHELFGQKPKGFWPSEMAFCMEMIPALRAAGYEYVVVDHVHVQPVEKDGPIDPFVPYKAKFNDAEIIIIPRHRDLSNAQESGLNPQWFTGEVTRLLAGGKRPAPLVTTWSDGENGGWFRQMDENSGFWGYFFAPLMDMVKAKTIPIVPVKMSEYIKKFPPQKYATVRTGAWNVGSTSGYDFSQWAGSSTQKQAIDALFAVSKKYWELKTQKLSPEKARRLAQARRIILDAETSCYLFWGEMWLPKVYERINAAKAFLE